MAYNPQLESADMWLRRVCVEYAQKANTGDTMKLARDIYLFVGGNDPIVDRQMELPLNVVSLSDHRKQP